MTVWRRRYGSDASASRRFCARMLLHQEVLSSKRFGTYALARDVVSPVLFGPKKFMARKRFDPIGRFQESLDLPLSPLICILAPNSNQKQ